MIVVSEILSFVVALPMYLVLRRFRRVGPRECVLAGIAVTVIFNAAGLLFSASPWYSAGDSGGDTVVNGLITAHGYVRTLISTAFQSVLGVAIAIMFWFISLRGRPS